jgi:hypothetical protein
MHDSGRDKEVAAALHPDKNQYLDYSALTDPDQNGLLDEGRSEVIDGWQRAISKFKELIRDQSHIYIPTYQKNKNISYQSQENYWNASDEFPYSKHNHHRVYDVTQRDLMVWHHQTGQRIEGPMELRYTLTRNDLKGRWYYAIGGSGTWPSLFVKQIVKDILNLIPGTHVRLRYKASRITEIQVIGPDEILITYDFTSFTTSLAELKYFLTYLARQLEDVDIKFLDVYYGVDTMNLGQYIHEYNLEINMNAIFDASRSGDYKTLEVFIMLHQCRSGMLGVQGNIGFSTLNHGLFVSTITTRQYCTVGDDTLFACAWELRDQVIRRAQNYCTIHADKFHTWTPNELHGDVDDIIEQIESQAFQFLKRPLRLSADNVIETGFLPAFPGIADLLLPADAHHRSNDQMSKQDTFMSIAKQYGRYLSFINDVYSNDISADEAELITHIMEAVYSVFSIPHTGLPRGSIISDRKGAPLTDRFIPPIGFTTFEGLWEEKLCSSFHGMVVSVADTSECSIPAPGYAFVGQSFECTLHRVQRVMIDLGYFTDDGIRTKQITLSSGFGYELHEMLTADSLISRKVHKITCIKEPPSWYFDVLADDSPDPMRLDKFGRAEIPLSYYN